MKWRKREDWCFAWRNAMTHGHQTNNFAEASVRLFKDIVLGRNKAYNAVALIDFVAVVLEEYYERRLRNFSHNRCETPRLQLNAKLAKSEYLKSNDIIQISEHKFQVPSEASGCSYFVDCKLGSCSCSEGELGKFCKHQAGVFLHHQIIAAHVPRMTAEARYEMAVLASGDRAPPLSFFMPLRLQESEKSKTSPSCSRNDETFSK
ncbi:hypothetical protein X975_16980, partial [Stegodyphus mimosarum]